MLILKANSPHDAERFPEVVRQATVNAKLKELAALRDALARYHPNYAKQSRRHERASQLVEELRQLGHLL